MQAIGAATLEALTVSLTKLEEALESWNHCGARLSVIIEREQTAIQTFDIHSIESSLLEKTNLAKQFEQCFASLREQIRDFTNLVPLQDVRYPINLSELKDVFHNCLQVIPDSTLAGRVFQHKVRVLINQIENILTESLSLKPAIEANVYLTRRLLNHHRENYRFWQEVALESSSTYNVRGRSKPSSSSPMLQVKT